jgi:hypothetical protein
MSSVSSLIRIVSRADGLRDNVVYYRILGSVSFLAPLRTKETRLVWEGNENDLLSCGGYFLAKVLDAEVI